MYRLASRNPSLPFIAPFVLFIALLGIREMLGLNPAVEYPARVILVGLVFLLLSRGVVTWRASRPIESVFVGLLVFSIWILPDVIWPSYRNSWLFRNSLTGVPESSIPIDLRSNAVFIAFRFFGTAAVVPVIEELFWRGWLMRYIVDSDFQKVPLGTYSGISFWSTALLFASEHGPFWDVGLVAGILYNWWMVRTKSIFDCVVAHAVTNASLAIYVIGFKQWQYWL